MKIKNVQLNLWILLSIVVFNSFIKTENLFFDMGGVLLKTSKFRAFKKLGIKTIAHTDLKERFFEFMHFIDKEKSRANNATFQGTRLTSFLCDWQKGVMSCQDVVAYLLKEIDNNKTFFKGKTERELIQESAKLMLPENSIKVSKLIKEMIRTAKECKDKKDENGKPAHTLFLTSNCDMQTFNSIKKRFPEITQLFDEDKLVISGAIGKIKPDVEFFDFILKKYSLSPSNCILIDDQIENAEGAQKCGIKVIHHQTTLKTRKQMKKLKVL